MVCSSVEASTFTMLCSHLHNLIPENFVTPEGNPISIKQSLPNPFFQSLTTTNLFIISMNLLNLDILYKWNHATCGLL